MTASSNPDWESELIKRLGAAKPESRRPASNDGELFHYTTAEGLKGIIENNCLWATAASYLNDASEIEYGCALLEEVFTDWHNANRNNTQSVGAEVLEISRKGFNNPVSKQERATGIYVACFCEQDNLLSQWRAYGQTGGYAVGFSILGRDRFNFLTAENPDFLISLVPVIYDRTIQAQRLHRILTDIVSILNEPSILKEAEAEGKTGKVKIYRAGLVALDHYLMEEITAFKNEAFAEEQEWRVVVRPKVDKEFAGLRNADDDSSWVHFRTTRGMMVPYTKLVPAITDWILPINSVRIGPSLDKARAENGLAMLLLRNKHRSFKIRGSEIPVLL